MAGFFYEITQRYYIFRYIADYIMFYIADYDIQYTIKPSVVAVTTANRNTFRKGFFMRMIWDVGDYELRRNS